MGSLNAGVDLVRVSKFVELTGYTEPAVRAKIKESVWQKDVVWFRAPDGCILLSLGGYESWASGQGSAR